MSVNDSLKELIAINIVMQENYYVVICTKGQQSGLTTYTKTSETLKHSFLYVYKYFHCLYMYVTCTTHLKEIEK